MELRREVSLFTERTEDTTTIVSLTDGGGQDERAEGAGLVQSHISDREPTVEGTVMVYADLTKVHLPGGEQVGGGKRGACTGFTAQSRKRLLEQLAKCRNCNSGLFVTLTYPGEYSFDPRRWKRDLATFRKRLLRIQPNCGAFWRLEFQKRGAPHFHLLIFNQTASARRLRQWIKLAWYQIVGSGDERHYKAGTQVDLITSRKHAMCYASKYAAKTSDQDVADQEALAHLRGVGRVWGTFGNLDFEEAMIFTVTPEQAVELKRMVSRWMASKKSKFSRRLARSRCGVGFSAFGLGDLSCPLWSRHWHNTAYRMLEKIDGRLLVNNFPQERAA